MGAAATPRSSLFARVDYQAFLFLYVGFTLLPILAGLDKFFQVLAMWDMYLAPVFARIIGNSTNFMMLVGIVEIAAGVLVAFRPQIGAYVVAIWLWAIILNLLLVPGYYDVALRDLALSLAALALARLSREFDSRPLGV
jgi:hypothetical protein